MCVYIHMYVWYVYILYIHIYHNEETISGGKSVNIITLNIKLCIYIKWGIIMVILFWILKHEVQCLFLDSSSVLWTYSVLSSWWQWETVITLSVSSSLSSDPKNRDRSTYFMRVTVELLWIKWITKSCCLEYFLRAVFLILLLILYIELNHILYKNIGFLHT